MLRRHSKPEPEFSGKMDKISFIGQDVSAHDVLTRNFTALTQKNAGIPPAQQSKIWHYLC
jgi:aspartokinase